MTVAHYNGRKSDTKLLHGFTALFVSLVVTVGAIVVPTTSASAAPTNVLGTVVDETSAPLEGILVEVLDASETVLASATTITDGTFEVTVEPGIYNARLTTPAARVILLPDVDFSPSNPVTLILYAEGVLVDVTVVAGFEV